MTWGHVGGTDSYVGPPREPASNDHCPSTILDGLYEVQFTNGVDAHVFTDYVQVGATDTQLVTTHDIPLVIQLRNGISSDMLTVVKTRKLSVRERDLIWSQS